MLDFFLSDKGETGFGAGDDDAAELEFLHHSAGCLFDERVFIADRIGENGVDFFEVRRDIVRTGVLHPVRPFRVDDDRHVVRFAGSDDGLAVFFRADAFAVVGNNEAVQAFLELLLDVIQKTGSIVSGDGRRFFKVEPEHLLMPADDTEFRRGRTVGLDETFAGDASLMKFLQQAFAVVVIAHETRDGSLAAEARQVVRHIRRTAECLHFRAYVGDRHRGFRGNAGDFAVVVFVEHDVTCNEDAAARGMLIHKVVKFFLFHNVLSQRDDAALVVSALSGQFARGLAAVAGQQFFAVFHHDIDGDVFHAGHVVLAFFRAVVDTAGVAGLRRPDDNVFAIIGVEGRHWARAEHGDDRYIHRDADVHRAGVGRQKEAAAAKQSRQHGKADFSGEDMYLRTVFSFHFLYACLDDRHICRTTQKGDVIAFFNEAVSTLGKVGIDPALRHPACTDIEGDDTIVLSKFFLPEVGGFLFLFGRQPHLEASVIELRASSRFLQDLQMAERLVHDLVLRRVRHRQVWHPVVKETMEKGLRVTDDFLPAGKRRDRRGSLIAMVIDHEVKVTFPYLPDEADERQNSLVSPVLVDQDAFVDVFIAAHEIGQRFVCQKRDVGFRIVCPQRSKRRRHQHEVTDVHRIDDENIFVCGSHTRFL